VLEAELFLCTMDPFARAILTRDMNRYSAKSDVWTPAYILILGFDGLSVA
jgi:hypothetical protein